MRSLLLFLLLLPAVCFSQGLIGKWADEKRPEQVIEFKADGMMDILYSGKPRQGATVYVKYSIISEGGETFLLRDICRNEKVLRHSKDKFVLEGDTLTIHENISIVDTATGKESFKIKEIIYTRVKE